MDVTLNDFFDDTNIFITGSSGFIVKVLVEKLLRSQTNINKLYLLIRPKKGKAIEDRVKEDIFSKPVNIWLYVYWVKWFVLSFIEIKS